MCKTIKLKDGLEIRVENNKYELWIYFNPQVYYKLFDISEETYIGLMYDAKR